MRSPVKVYEMLRASLLDSPTPSYGAIRVLAPLPEVLSNKFSHIQEAYQNLPQIGRPIILPLNYKYNSFNQPPNLHHHHEEDGYSNNASDEFQIISPYKGKLQVMRKADYMSSKRNEDGAFNKRDGNGHGWGGGHKKSQALSALALLGFMFFLNLIQTSLQNNRALLAAASGNATALQVVAGRRIRDKRAVAQLAFHDDSKMNRMSLPNLQTVHQRNFSITPSKGGGGHVHFTSSIPSSPNKGPPGQTLMMSENTIENFKSASLHCLQLLSCKLAKYIVEDMEIDATTRILLHVMRESVTSRVSSTKSWTGRMIRAFTDGWERKKTCENLYNQCQIFNFKSLRRAPRFRKRKKMLIH